MIISTILGRTLRFKSYLPRISTQYSYRHTYDVTTSTKFHIAFALLSTAYLDYGGCDYGECDYGGLYGECDPNPNPYQNHTLTIS